MFSGVAIVHDWLIAMRRGERALQSLLALFPDADLFTCATTRPKCRLRCADSAFNRGHVDVEAHLDTVIDRR